MILASTPQWRGSQAMPGVVEELVGIHVIAEHRVRSWSMPTKYSTTKASSTVVASQAAALAAEFTSGGLGPWDVVMAVTLPRDGRVRIRW